VSLFNNLSWEECDRLIESLLQHKFEAGADIVREGDTGTELYIISEGTVAVTKLCYDEFDEPYQNEIRKM
jgi:CRP-like cAMP-binding protein